VADHARDTERHHHEVRLSDLVHLSWPGRAMKLFADGTKVPLVLA
jgi:hypothetical protein